MGDDSMNPRGPDGVGRRRPSHDRSSLRDTAEALVGLWDQLLLLGGQIHDGDWERATPAHGLDVRGLVDHIAGVDGRRAGPGAPTDPVAGLRAAAARVAREHRHGAPRSDRVLAANCLGTWIHAYDLGSTLGAPVDLDEASTAVMRASGYILSYLPQLLALGRGAGVDRSVRIVVRGAGAHDGVAAVSGGRGLWLPPDHASEHSVTATPAALVLLLSGRAAAEDLRAAGALEWAGTAADDLVRHLRLPG